MNGETLRKLVADGETLSVEFKGEERSQLNDRALVETIVCLANQSSGASETSAYLLVGVEDDGRVTGARARHGSSTDANRLVALVAGRTMPPVSVQVEILTVGGGEVIVIEIPPQRQPVSTSEGVSLRRTIGGDGRPACVPMDMRSAVSLQADRGLLDTSAQVVEAARWDDLDPLEFERFRRSVRERRGRSDESLLELSDLDLAKALGVVEANGFVAGVRLAGLLLFGKEHALRKFVPNHEVGFQVLRGLDVEVNDFFHWPLLRVTEEIESRIRARNREQELMVGLLRVGVPDYPEKALREGLANALIHRDYQLLGAVHFQWHENRIEISSPGGFPEGVHLGNLLVTAPRPRNPLLADAFKRAGIVDRTARGIDTIFAEQLRNGRPAPSYERSQLSTVVLVLPGGEANLHFVRLLVEEGRANRPVSLDELLLLNGLWRERAITTETAARLIQKPEGEARGALNRLVEAGLVEARGARKARVWHLSAATYRRLGERAAYVHQRGFEQLQQEQMVLQYVETHGRITRREAADLCRLSPDQAYRLLRKLVTDGRLTPYGAKKGAWYQLRG